MPTYKAAEFDQHPINLNNPIDERCRFGLANIHVLQHEVTGKFAAEEARVLEGIRSKALNNQIAPFATTRFFGSKRKQLGWIAAELEQFKGKTALDAFGGTGSVTHALSVGGWTVTYNDIFEFNNVCARAIFRSPFDTFTESEFERLLNRVEPLMGFISKTFEGIFFLPDENAWLDGFLHEISNINGPARDILLYCLFQSCLMKRPFNLFHRANLNIRCSTTPVKFGNRTTWNRSFPDLMKRTFRDLITLQRSIDYKTVTVASARCASKVEGDFDLIYLDPPYFKQSKRNTDSYLQRYHFLEGIARYDEWPDLIDKSSAIRAIQSKTTTEWTDKKTLIKNVEGLICRFDSSSFMLSYVAGEAPSEQEWYSLFSKYFSSIKLIQRPFGKALSLKNSFEFILVGLR